MKKDQNDKPEEEHKHQTIKGYNELIDISDKQRLFDNPHLKEEWESLISKHKLRYNLWMVINLNNELNVTQISKVVGSSKSTISRVLKSMEMDGLLVSHRGEIKEGGRERIPPKYYRINKKFKKDKDAERIFMEKPIDP
jgi:DNA-binding transcriptional ArsR family regulator